MYDRAPNGGRHESISRPPRPGYAADTALARGAHNTTPSGGMTPKWKKEVPVAKLNKITDEW